MRTTWYWIALVIVLAPTLGMGPVQAETVNCTPITPPFPVIITVQGIYCFTQHLNTAIPSDAAIEIQTNNVILDLNGWKLGGLAAGPGTNADGILAVNRQNITIKNGTVRGFYRGINLAGGASQGHVVEDIRADQNTFAGILVEGSGTLVRNNQVVATGGTTTASVAEAFGILVVGLGPQVLNNDVIDTQGTGGADGLGILFATSVSGGLAVNNRITNANVGIKYDPTSTGKYRDNLTTGVTTPFTGAGGTSVGIND